MIAFLTLCYAGFIWLVFFKLKLLKWNVLSQSLVVVIGCAAVFMLLVLMNLYQPAAVQAVVSQRVTAIVARVQGRVVEVPVGPNERVSKGDVLLRIEPGPYQAEVDRLDAALAEAVQAVPQLRAAWDEAKAATRQAAAERDFAVIEYGRVLDAFEQQAASQNEMDRATSSRDARDAALDRSTAAEERARLAYESEIAGENTTVAQLKAQLARAHIDLGECTIHAPADGWVTQLFVEPGAVTLTASFSAVMSFVYDRDVMVRATFRANARHHMQVGDKAEILFDTVPGRVFEGEVAHLVIASGAGALTPSGELLTTAQFASPDLVLVAIAVDHSDLIGQLQIGTGCDVAVYTDGMQPIGIVRKVMMRMGAWMSYL